MKMFINDIFFSRQMNRNSLRNSNGQMPVNYLNNQTSQNIHRPNNAYVNSNNANYNSEEIETIHGVYKNGRLMHTVTSLIGCLVEVELANGERYEGIFKTFSPKVINLLLS